ncbi:hypothetical protein BL250_01060 [Erwinia sp. OLTSP20]|nr:hypothetical protein BV501_04595 [Erwinia sp. OAMSP11]PIJ74101.1 hypothetical protein BK416_04885 [Erwinia sp. OLSSP12]PIJ79802.1 hypothetical protein BLD47_12875 [Erwinia sp. OLCASP19]PIJ86064.1 hypothetical protein BLD46_04680 [Erwinia sp. OLMTSP26]PIJ87813.1 hypothetical protein BLD49_04680 [Erwinia sp. OLMDSP33]PIJ90845.1 hypothetical protein BL249_11100 [Erwinia sp. OLFS4]PIJ95228.1 hypothetical protein BL250_01060 [Erwinia sp. OLTSP20]
MARGNGLLLPAVMKCCLRAVLRYLLRGAKVKNWLAWRISHCSVWGGVLKPSMESGFIHNEW